jgi:carboxypeptidase C (cathepsin A)
MKLLLGLSAITLLFACSSPQARAQAHEKPEAKPDAKQDAKPDKPAEKGDAKKDGTRSADEIVDTQSVTHHSVAIDGKPIAYTAKAGTIVLREEDGKKKASVFYVAYTRDDTADPATRPITFSFNGGPGSSSVWLHLGVLGPKRVDMGPDGLDFHPPFKLVDNELSWLEFTDLVFIDPVTTGFSRAVPGESDSPYHGVEGDVQSVAEFIRLHTTREKRWASPKFLAGESYGTTRASALASYLENRSGIYLNGIVLVSVALNFQTLEFDAGNDLPYEVYVPTYAATAFYHKKLAPELQRDLHATLDEVEKFTANEYALALRKGSALSDAERKSIAEKLARYTGLSREYVERTNLRIQIERYCKELERADRRTVGRLDSRFEGIDHDAAGEVPDADPSFTAIMGPFTSALNNYLRTELNYESDLVYEIITGRVHPWKFDNTENRYLNVAERLRQALTQNPSLRVFVACGYYDLATPYYAAHYTFDHLGMDREISGRISYGHYEAGHMMYIHGPSRAQMRKDVRDFYSAALVR